MLARVGERESKGVEGTASIGRVTSIGEEDGGDSDGDSIKQGQGRAASVAGSSVASTAVGDGTGEAGDEEASKALCVYPLSEMNVTSTVVCCARCAFLGASLAALVGYSSGMPNRQPPPPPRLSAVVPQSFSSSWPSRHPPSCGSCAWCAPAHCPGCLLAVSHLIALSLPRARACAQQTERFELPRDVPAYLALAGCSVRLEQGAAGTPLTIDVAMPRTRASFGAAAPHLAFLLDEILNDDVLETGGDTGNVTVVRSANAPIPCSMAVVIPSDLPQPVRFQAQDRRVSLDAHERCR